LQPSLTTQPAEAGFFMAVKNPHIPVCLEKHLRVLFC
jgi:hypothetical protein